jgi:hypothetical protein
VADDRKRNTPALGSPHPRVVERRSGSHSDHTERRVQQSQRAEDEMTPVGLIKIVREELKGDIEAVDGKVDAVAAKVDALDSSMNSAMRSVERLTGEVSTTNKLLPQMLETIRDELRSRRTVDEHMVLSQADVWRHREITSTDTEAADRGTTRKVKLKIVGFVFSAGGLGALIALAASRC